MLEKGILLSVLSGACAATGSVLGKSISSEDGSSLVSLIIMASYVILMLSFNTAAMLLYVKALNSSESSLPATVISTAVNYCCSALLGWLLFEESCGLYWWMGSSFVLAGIVLMNRSTPSRKKVD